MGAFADVQEALAPFLERHPNSELKEVKSGGKDRLVIASPWGDPTLVLSLPDMHADAVALLNRVRLPESLSAIWHEETKDLEVIWTAYRLSKSQLEVSERCFSFEYKGKAYECSFGESSEELLAIAKMAQIASNPSHTFFRNLQSFMKFSEASEKGELPRSLEKPRSFWIHKADFDEVQIIDFINQLNFYLVYYDAQSPTIIIHPIDETKSQPRNRYVQGNFPKKIVVAKDLDSTLLQFWAATAHENEMLRFILFYRIIEYVSSHYLDAAVRERLKRIISDPTAADRIDDSLSKVINAFEGSKLEEVPRFNKLLTVAVEPKILWKEIENNRECFESATQFEGGFEISALIARGQNESSWNTNSVEQFGHKIRQLRNALAHGKDQQSAKVILPSVKNMHLLHPWNNLIAAAAAEVILYDGVV